MKNLLFPMLYLNFALFAKTSDPFTDLKQATEKSCFEGLSEWENAYGPFDGDQAKRQIKEGTQAVDHEMSRLILETGNNCLSQKQQYEVTAVMDQLDAACNTSEMETDSYSKDKQGITIHKCYEIDGPEIVIITRTLDIDVNFTPKVIKTKRICKGHHEKRHYSSKSDTKKKEKEWIATYSKDPTIKSYDVEFNGSMWNGYDVYLSYKHKTDALNCKNYKTEEKVKQAEIKHIIKEEWIEEPESYQTLLQDPQSTFIQKQCLDTTPVKTINGLLIERPCWKEQYAFLRKKQPQQLTECDALRNKNCKLMQSLCVQGTADNCQLWELTFECFDQFKISSTETFSAQTLDLPIEPNTFFNDVVTKLAVFKEMKEELANSKSMDPLALEIFKGSKKQCNKSIASDVIYDCCFSYSGLAKKLGLAKCNADEIALASLREEGLCHYIGIKEDKFLDLLTTNYEHVFCCFPTKLGRVLNEQARKQLNMSWGTAKHPNCQGLTIEQLQEVNFDQLNLEEVFEKDLHGLNQRYTDKTKNLKDPVQAQQQIDAIKKKMTDKIKAIHGN